MLLAAIEGDRYPAVRHLAARALGQLLAAVPTADARLARLRAEARQADIDIGE